MLNFVVLDMLQHIGKLGPVHAIELSNLDFKMGYYCSVEVAILVCLFISPCKMFAKVNIYSNFNLSLG